MQTNTPPLRTIAVTVVFVLGCLAIAIGLWSTFGGKLPFQAQPYEVRVAVPSAQALYANNDVRMAGIGVGKIRKVEQRGSGAVLTLGIKPEFAPLRTSTVAIVRSKSLLGEGYLELAPGKGASSTTIADRGTIPVRNVRAAQQLDDVLQTFSPETRAPMRSMTVGAASAFRGRGGDLNDVLGRSVPLTRNLDQALEELDEQTVPTRRLIDNADQVFTAAGERSSVLRAAIREGDRLFSITADRDRQLGRTISALPPFLTQLRAASAELGAASGDLDVATRALSPTVPLVTPAIESLDRDLPAFRNAFAKVKPPLRSGIKAFPALTRTLRTTEPATEPTYQAMRELIPFLRLASTNRKAFVANFGILSSLLNSTYIGSGQKPAHFPSAYLTAWNEIIGGYTKKLPTSTANPYPKPTAPEIFPKEGSLRAYDCRNTGNAAVVPAFGTVPKCRVQGPWTFNGKSAYYPRLLREAP